MEEVESVKMMMILPLLLLSQGLKVSYRVVANGRNVWSVWNVWSLRSFQVRRAFVPDLVQAPIRALTRTLSQIQVQESRHPYRHSAAYSS